MAARSRLRHNVRLMVPLLLIALLVWLEPSSQGSAGDPPPPATATEPSTPATTTPAPPRRVWVVLDFYKEFGGTVVREDAESLVLRTRDGSERTLDRNSVVNAIPLLDDPEGTDVVVHYRDGRAVRAELIEDTFDAATVRIAGMRTVLPRTALWGLERRVPFETQLARLRAAIPADAWSQRVELARWAMREDHPEIAVEELQAALRIQDTDEVRRLLRLAEIDVRTRQSRQGKSDRDTPPAGDPGVRGDQSDPARLNEGQVNLIRVMELDLRRPPRMQVSPALAARIVEIHGPSGRLPAEQSTVEALAALPPARLLALLFDLKARDLYDQVQVLEDPEHLATFRKRVHDVWLIPNCATSRCHGGDQAGSFQLLRDRPRDARTAYTNLLRMLDHRLADGSPLLDLDEPRASALLDLAGPPDRVRHPHPQVPGWRPILVGDGGVIRSNVEAWLRGMYRPRPIYPFTLDPYRAGPGGNTGGER